MKPIRKKILAAVLSVTAIYLLIIYRENVGSFIVLIFSAFVPVLAGFAVAYVLNILMSFYERFYFRSGKRGGFVEKTRRPICLFGAVLTLLGLSALIVILVVPELIDCLKLLVSEVPPVIEGILETDFVTKILPDATIDNLLSINWQEHIVNLADVVTTGIGNAATAIFSAITSVVSVVVTVFLSIIISIYLLLYKEKLTADMEKLTHYYLSEKFALRISRVLEVADDCFHRYIVGQCAEATILGFLCWLGMVVLGIPYAGMIGAMIGLTALVPIAGAYIGAGLGAIMILSVSPAKAVMFLIFIIILQQIEGNFIYPKVVGKSVGLPPVYVLLAITVGGGLAGIAGMIFSVPVASVIYRLIQEDIIDKKIM